MSVFRDLLAIKRHRETVAETDFLRARLTLGEANAAVEAGTQALNDYRVWALAHERDLYRAICARTVKVREIEDLRADVVGLRARELRLEDELNTAEKVRRDAQRARDQAEGSLRAASRQKDKFVELTAIHDEEAWHEWQRREDAEAEDFRVRDRDAEWGGGDDDHSNTDAWA